MTKLYIMKRILLSIICVIALFACAEEEPVPVAVESVKLNHTSLTLTVGDTTTLIATVLPEDAENKTVFWEVDDNNIARVSEDGCVEAVGSGITIVTARTEDGDKAVQCEVTVVSKDVPVTGISLSTYELSVVEGESVSLEFKIEPEDATNEKVIWTIQDSTIATISSYSSFVSVYGVSPGETIIEAITEDGGYTAECRVIVGKDYQTQTQGPVTLMLGEVTATTATLFGTLDMDTVGDYDMADGGVGVIYAMSTGDLTINRAEKLPITSVDSSSGFNFNIAGLKYNTSYKYTIYLYKSGVLQYGKTQYFETEDVVLTVENVATTKTSATFSGVNSLRSSDLDEINVGVLYSKDKETVSSGRGTRSEIEDLSAYSHTIGSLDYATTYYFCCYVEQDGKYSYDDVREFATQPFDVTIGFESATQTTATFSGNLDVIRDEDIDVGISYWHEGKSKIRRRIKDEEIDYNGVFEVSVDGLLHGSTYNYCYYTYHNQKYLYGEPQQFTTQSVPVTLDVTDVTQTKATFTGSVDFTEPDAGIEVGVLYIAGNHSDFTATTSGVVKEILTPDGSGLFSSVKSGLQPSTTYSYRSYIYHLGSYTYGEIRTFTTLIPYISGAVDLSASETANCYIVSEPGTYQIKAVKGNSKVAVGTAVSATVLWESFGTSQTPEIGDLVVWAYCTDGYLYFEVPSDYKEGNAVIAARDSDGNILWSWHIWFTDEPQGQVYYNNAGTMMDRNLGATSATPGDVGALGLLYQWGRKDPFLGSSSISDDVDAKSTITWPSKVSSDPSNGTIAYATANPTTFIGSNSNNYDWYYTGDSSTDNTRWTTSEISKSIYDPCPQGWRVPDGGENGIWSKALGSSSHFNDESLYNSTNAGMNFSGKFGSDQTIWYPVSGSRSNGVGSLSSVGYICDYCSASSGYFLYFSYKGNVHPSGYSSNRAVGNSVRCLQE